MKPGSGGSFSPGEPPVDEAGLILLWNIGKNAEAHGFSILPDVFQAGICIPQSAFSSSQTAIFSLRKSEGGTLLVAWCLTRFFLKEMGPIQCFTSLF